MKFSFKTILKRNTLENKYEALVSVIKKSTNAKQIKEELRKIERGTYGK